MSASQKVRTTLRSLSRNASRHHNRSLAQLTAPVAVSIQPLVFRPNPHPHQRSVRSITEPQVESQDDAELFLKIKDALRGRPEFSGLNINRSVIHRGNSRPTLLTPRAQRQPPSHKIAPQKPNPTHRKTLTMCKFK